MNLLAVSEVDSIPPVYFYYFDAVYVRVYTMDLQQHFCHISQVAG
jgi:hypothetical protein